MGHFACTEHSVSRIFSATSGSVETNALLPYCIGTPAVQSTNEWRRAQILYPRPVPCRGCVGLLALHGRNSWS